MGTDIIKIRTHSLCLLDLLWVLIDKNSTLIDREKYFSIFLCSSRWEFVQLKINFASLLKGEDYSNKYIVIIFNLSRLCLL